MSDQKLTSKLGHPTEPKYKIKAETSKNPIPNNFFIFISNFFFRNLSYLISTLHVPYKNHYSRGQFQEQGLLPIWSLYRSKWLNNSDKIRKQVKNYLPNKKELSNQTLLNSFTEIISSPLLNKVAFKF